MSKQTVEKVNLLKEVPLINNRKQLKKYLKPTFILSDYMVDYDTYEEFQTRIYNLIKGCFVIRECREYPVKFKFNREDKKSQTLELRHFLINLIVWYPFVELSDLKVLDASFILDCYNDIPNLEDYLNHTIMVLRDYHLTSTKVNNTISMVLYKLRKIGEDFSIILGLNFSAHTFIDMYQKNADVRRLMETEFTLNQQPHEIEEILNQSEKELIDIFKSIPDNPLGVILRAGTGIKHKQFREFLISSGLKPTLTGETIPEAINNSTLVGGLDRPSYAYIDGLGARKSLIMNKKVMGKAGYFAKIVLLLVRTVSISKTVSDCGTKHLVTYEIKNKNILKKLNGKYYKLEDDDDLKVLDSKKDKDLIGKKIKVRSAATCACGENHVCSRCIGTTIVMNSDIMDGFSAFESEEETKVINQSILSTKHLLTTDSEVIKFNAEFYNFFTIIGGEINPIINENQNVPNIDDYAIFIDPNDMMKMEEMDNDSLYNTLIYNGRFSIQNVEDPEEPLITIQTDIEKEIFITEDTLKLMKKGKGLIYFKDLDDDVKLFEMTILNNELTKPLYELMNLINLEKKDNIVESIDTMSQKYMELLIDSKIDASIVSAELIINRLIRSVEDMYRRPDFSKETLEPYQIFTVRRALEKNASPLIGISFENIKRQFTSDELYDIRTSPSYIDVFYKKEISTTNLKKYAVLSEQEKDNEVF